MSNIHLISAMNLTVASGDLVNLPCELKPSLADDLVRLILWFKNDITGGPIYSVDARHSLLQNATQFSSSHEFKSRASFKVTSECPPCLTPATLTLSPVDHKDSGIFRCRVDFKKSRTKHTVIHLNVIGEYNDIRLLITCNRTSIVQCYFSIIN